MEKLIGWTSAYVTDYKELPLTKEREQAIVEVVRRRHYDFTYNDMCYLPYCCPIFEDKTISMPNRSQWEQIMSKVYSNIARTHRLIPSDAIKRQPIEDIIYENKNDEPQEENS